ncbi:uncharacterized protein LOC116412978 [Galleria mellonella]|uniref:Uncharacterized protein LOC116412978 n=1 Tax=Galleria mellonella TaxID=7137 RepID=A0A6J3C2W9_GALME|nr:uncharacterized protein LOC116412978 [Galleria mellonella]XP_031765269.1 uncharacterized protein LOC116412978 [Galleria mellonella]XP_052750315.1 uncharacterized protein LOC116412978 [Galleria mellonella]
MTNINTEVVLRKLLDNIAKEHNYKDPNVNVRAITTAGANYSSVLYIVIISAPKKEELQLFAKVAIVGKVARSQLHLPLFDIERFAYKELLPAYEKIQDKNNLSKEKRLVWPKFYGCNQNLYEETIVLENLAIKGYVTYDRLKSVNWGYASKAVETLAKFHALSIAYGEENPTQYAELIQKMKVKPNSLDKMAGTLDKLTDMAVGVIKEENKERLKQYISKEGDLKNITTLYQSTGIIVLNHGDYRPSNLMHKMKDDGSLDIIPIDFQTISANSPVHDLYYFIFTSSDEEFRRKYYEQLLDHYYQQLCRALRNLNLDSEKHYPKKSYEKDLKEFVRFGLFHGVFSLPMITVDAENAPALHGEDGINCVQNIKTSDLYLERLNGIVNDYVRWGIL